MREIERKFLVRSLPGSRLRGWSRHEIVQAYLSFSPEVRIRIVDDRRATLTVKSQGILEREEFEYSIPLRGARRLLRMHRGRVIRKVRCRSGRFEIDLYQGELAGLRVAEVELRTAREPVPKPPEGLVLGRDVTSDRRYRNAFLARGSARPPGK